MTDNDLIQQATLACATRTLDDIGAATYCWRHSWLESNRAYAWRLAVHIQQSIIDREQLVRIVLGIQNHPSCKE